MSNEIIISILIFVAGLIANHVYYICSKKDQIKLFKKLPENIRKAIMENDISIKELNDLIQSKSIE